MERAEPVAAERRKSQLQLLLITCNASIFRVLVRRRQNRRLRPAKKRKTKPAANSRAQSKTVDTLSLWKFP